MPPLVGSSVAVLVLTDVEGSTRLWADHPDLMGAVMARHHELVHAAITARGGWRPLDQGEGDAVFAAFESATAAVAAVVDFERALWGEQWPPGIDIRVRVGVHAGEVTARGGNLFGSTVNRCARLRGLASGGQVLLSAPVFELVRDHLPDTVSTTDLGAHRMRDLTRPEHVHQLIIPGLIADFPPLASLDRAAHNLPIQTSSFLGRERDVSDLVDLVTRERLVTVVGFGGMGKTRLALQVAAELALGDGDGVWFIDLSAVTDPARVPALIATTLGIAEADGGPLPAVLAWLREKQLLLVLDNVEQLLPDIATLVDQLVTAGPQLRLLSTSREPVRLRGEHVYHLSPLPVPPTPRAGEGWTEAELGSLSTYGAVELFIARATAAHRNFALTASNAAAIAAICARLDGLPLALELAAARTRLLSPEALLTRLDQALRLLTGGSRDLPSRHQTLRATIAWSYDSLGSDQQQLLDRLSVFPGTFTLDAAEHICAGALVEGAPDIEILDAMEGLVDRSLVRGHPATADQAEDRFSLLVSIRDFSAEQLSRSGDVGTLVDRHATYYAQLTTRPPDYSHDEMAAIMETVHSELHNLSSALAYRQLGNAPEEELALALNVVFVLSELGRYGEARAIIDHALGRNPNPSPDRIRLMSMRGVNEANMGQLSRARQSNAETLVEARLVGEPSLLIDQLADSVIFSAGSIADARSTLREVASLLEYLPVSGTYLPSWLVRWNFEINAVDWMYADIDWAEATTRKLLTAASKRGKTRLYSGYLSYLYSAQIKILIATGRLEEAAPILRAFVDLEYLADAPDSDRLIRNHVFATFHIAMQQYESAASHLDLVERLAESLDLPQYRAVVQVERATIEKLTGAPEAALRRLVNTSANPTADPENYARIYWLRAVLARETGASPLAAELLRQAWDVICSWQVPSFPLVLACLLEHAIQNLEASPSEAVLLIGMVNAHRDNFVLPSGAEYDTNMMLNELRDKLGSIEVDGLLTVATAQPLPTSSDLSSLLRQRAIPR